MAGRLIVRIDDSIFPRFSRFGVKVDAIWIKQLAMGADIDSRYFPRRLFQSLWLNNKRIFILDSSTKSS